MLKPSLQLRLGQQLTMTPQLQQAIRLLQLPALELQQQVREALEQNVMLEAEEDGPEYAPESDATLAEAGVSASDVEPPAGAADHEGTIEIEVRAAEGNLPLSGGAAIWVEIQGGRSRQPTRFCLGYVGPLATA